MRQIGPLLVVGLMIAQANADVGKQSSVTRIDGGVLEISLPEKTHSDESIGSRWIYTEGPSTLLIEAVELHASAGADFGKDVKGYLQRQAFAFTAIEELKMVKPLRAYGVLPKAAKPDAMTWHPIYVLFVADEHGWVRRVDFYVDLFGMRALDKWRMVARGISSSIRASRQLIDRGSSGLRALNAIDIQITLADKWIVERVRVSLLFELTKLVQLGTDQPKCKLILAPDAASIPSGIESPTNVFGTGATWNTIVDKEQFHSYLNVQPTGVQYVVNVSCASASSREDEEARRVVETLRRIAN